MNELFLLNGEYCGTGLLEPVGCRPCVSADFADNWLLDDAAIMRLMSAYQVEPMRERYRNWMINQGSVGKCNCSAAVGAAYRVRNRMGLPHVVLSDADLYVRISGGSDRGSMLDDALDVVREEGLAEYWTTAGKYPSSAYNRRQVPVDVWDLAVQSRPNYRSHEPVRIPTDGRFVRAVASCLARGWPVIMAWHVGNQTMRLRNGYIQQGRGPGNHASFLDGAKWVGGRDIVHPNLVNSWTSFDSTYGDTRGGWGDEGNGLITMDDLQQCKDRHVYYAMTSFVEPGP
jgi:hypothetical protein